ncbi:hypothetical protein AAC387_Pa03g4001 [Persea americana]
MAKLLKTDHSRTGTTIRGTRGYFAPEWFKSMMITAKVDVYSYGVMLLEIICCRKNIVLEQQNYDEEVLTVWAYDCYKNGRLDMLVDQEEEALNDARKLNRLVMVAIWCIQEEPSLRPSMKKLDFALLSHFSQKVAQSVKHDFGRIDIPVQSLANGQRSVRLSWRHHEMDI